MADIRRPSGRQTAQGAPAAPKVSGRAPTATSGRAPAAAPAPSGRAPASPTGSGRIPAATSGRAPAVPAAAPAPAPAARPSGVIRPSPSGRAPATQGSAKSLSPADVAPRASSARVAPAGRASGKSQRGGVGERGGAAPKKKVRGGPELLIAGGVIVVLAVACGIFYVLRTNEKKQVYGELEKREEIEKRNWKKALLAFDKAYAAGQQFVIGKQDFNADTMVKPFQGDPDIWNVIYEKHYKDKKAADKMDQQSVDNTRLTLYPMQKSKDEGEIHMSYGFGDSAKNVPVIIATKSVKGAEGDTANTGGKITVIVKAENDYNFDAAKNYKPPEKKEKGGEKAEKKE